MQSKSDNDQALSGPAFSRRTFLTGTAAVGLMAMTGTVAFMQPAFGVTEDTTAFMRASTFVTGRTTLNGVTGERFFAALAKRDAAFAQKISALLAFIDNAKLPNMDAFLEAPGADEALKETATTLVSAWYLGVVGKPQDAELITYADSLMYEPTRGVLAVPTYGPGPLAWGPKPEGTQAAPAGESAGKPAAKA